ncbi:hypothetical protein [Dokdonella ginsengisoli]|uniref:Molecular chaperone n=1 Tax=Dokdonella ginsengisoli TaxID=363846 RepID=A0ABV9QVP8_9GAMM
MSETYLRLGAALPPRQIPGSDAFRAEPRALRNWLDALPLANFGAAAGQVLDGLRRLNRQRGDASQRLDALEAMRPTVVQLAEAADRQIVGASFPLPAPKVELGRSALAFQDELALGYRIALVELCAPSGAVGFLRSRAVALAALRALQHGHEHLARAYLLYRAPPQGVWQALHDVHRFAAAARLDDRELDGTTARAAYAEALLLALLNPYRYTQREQGEAAAFARVLAPYVELRERGGGARDVPVQTDVDRGPGYVAAERAGKTAGVPALYLDRAFVFIDEQFARTPQGALATPFRQRGGSALTLDNELARRFVADLGAHATRGHVRLGGGYRFDSVLGLHDLHFVLAGGEEFGRFLRRSLDEPGEPEHAGRTAAAPRVARVPVRVLDQGLGGYRLLWDRGGAQNARVRVGELVGLALPEPEAGVAQDWLVGVVRWIRIDEQGAIDAGVELLARRALPVGVRAPASGDARAPVRGLLLASLERGVEAGYDSLVASIELARDATQVELVLPADEQGPPAPPRSVRVDGLDVLEETGLCRRFALPAGAAEGAAVASPELDEAS